MLGANDARAYRSRGTRPWHLRCERVEVHDRGREAPRGLDDEARSAAAQRAHHLRDRVLTHAATIVHDEAGIGEEARQSRRRREQGQLMIDDA
ncbi:MAG: hypothetical protein U0235_26690 [Polyangiaceae bacterium]